MIVQFADIMIFVLNFVQAAACYEGFFKKDFFCFFQYFIQHCFICRPSDSTVSEDAEIGPRTVATSAWAVGRSRSHPLLFCCC